MTSNATLYAELANAERNLVQAAKLRDAARAAIIESIKKRLGDMTPYAFARAANINWGNFHRVLVQAEWNAVIISQVLMALDGVSLPPIDPDDKNSGGGGSKSSSKSKNGSKKRSRRSK